MRETLVIEIWKSSSDPPVKQEFHTRSPMILQSVRFTSEYQTSSISVQDRKSQTSGISFEEESDRVSRFERITNV